MGPNSLTLIGILLDIIIIINTKDKFYGPWDFGSQQWTAWLTRVMHTELL